MWELRDFPVWWERGHGSGGKLGPVSVVVLYTTSLFSKRGTWSGGKAGWITVVVLAVLCVTLAQDCGVLWSLLLTPEAFPCVALVTELRRGHPCLLALQLCSGTAFTVALHLYLWKVLCSSQLPQ